jgi:hypothetical protein
MAGTALQLTLVHGSASDGVVVPWRRCPPQQRKLRLRAATRPHRMNMRSSPVLTCRERRVARKPVLIAVGCCRAAWRWDSIASTSEQHPTASR